VDAVRADEAGHEGAVDGRLDELLLRRRIQSLAPDSEPLRGQVLVEDRVVRGAAWFSRQLRA